MYTFSNYLAKVFSIIKSNILLSIIAKASFTFIFSSSCLCKSLLLNIFKLLKFLFNASIILFDESVTFLPSKANSFETMKFELIRDSIELLENDRSYALDKGYENVFYSTLIDLVLQLRKYDRSKFLSNIFKYSKYPKFLYILIFKLIEKIKKAI